MRPDLKEYRWAPLLSTFVKSYNGEHTTSYEMSDLVRTPRMSRSKDGDPSADFVFSRQGTALKVWLRAADEVGEERAKAALESRFLNALRDAFDDKGITGISVAVGYIELSRSALADLARSLANLILYLEESAFARSQCYELRGHDLPLLEPGIRTILDSVTVTPTNKNAKATVLVRPGVGNVPESWGPVKKQLDLEDSKLGQFSNASTTDHTELFDNEEVWFIDALSSTGCSEVWAVHDSLTAGRSSYRVRFSGLTSR